jgi:hypothetical protein
MEPVVLGNTHEASDRAVVQRCAREFQLGMFWGCFRLSTGNAAGMRDARGLF